MWDAITIFVASHQSLIQVVIALLMLWAAFEARRATSAARDGVEAQLVHSALSEYFEPIMAQSIRTLRSCQESHPEDFPQIWKKEMENTYGIGKEVDLARRKVKSYFENVVRLRKFRLIRQKAFRAIAYVHGLNTYYDVVIPLEDALNLGREKGTDNYLMEKLGRYKSPAPTV